MAEQLALFDVMHPSHGVPSMPATRGEEKPDAQAYIAALYDALRANPPCSWPAYTDDPVGTWRWVMRGIGHGLAAYSDREVREVLGRLYGMVAMAHMMTGAPMPKVDARHVTAWAMEARAEAMERMLGGEGDEWGYILVRVDDGGPLPLLEGASIVEHRGVYALVAVPREVARRQLAGLGPWVVCRRVYWDRAEALDDLTTLAGR